MSLLSGPATPESVSYDTFDKPLFPAKAPKTLAMMARGELAMDAVTLFTSVHHLVVGGSREIFRVNVKKITDSGFTEFYY